MHEVVIHGISVNGDGIGRLDDGRVVELSRDKSLLPQGAR